MTGWAPRGAVLLLITAAAWTGTLGRVGAAGSSDTEAANARQLLAGSVPTAYRNRCQVRPNSTLSPAQQAGAVSTLECTLQDGTEVTFIRYSSATALQQAYTGTYSPPFTVFDAAAQCEGSGVYQVAGRTAGSDVCIRDDPAKIKPTNGADRGGADQLDLQRHHHPRPRGAHRRGRRDAAHLVEPQLRPARATRPAPGRDHRHADQKGTRRAPQAHPDRRPPQLPPVHADRGRCPVHVADLGNRRDGSHAATTPSL